MSQHIVSIQSLELDDGRVAVHCRILHEDGGRRTWKRWEGEHVTQLLYSALAFVVSVSARWTMEDNPIEVIRFEEFVQRPLPMRPDDLDLPF